MNKYTVVYKETIGSYGTLFVDKEIVRIGLIIMIGRGFYDIFVDRLTSGDTLHKIFKDEDSAINCFEGLVYEPYIDIPKLMYKGFEKGIKDAI